MENAQIKEHEMKYRIIPSRAFLNQYPTLSQKSKELLNKKIEVLEYIPFRNKQLIGKNIFRIRFKDENKEKRLIYQIGNNQVFLVTILNRKHDYKDLKKYGLD